MCWLSTLEGWELGESNESAHCFQSTVSLKWLPCGGLWAPTLPHPSPFMEEWKELGASGEDSQSHRVVMMANALGRV